MVDKNVTKLMRRKVLHGTSALGLLAAVIILWLEPSPRRANSDGFPQDANEKALRQGIAKGSDSLTDDASDNGHLRSSASNEQERRMSLEKAIAAQEVLVAEKRAVLSRYILANAVIYQEAPDTPEDQGSDGAIDSQDIKQANEIGGFVDLKNALELELKNLERMKAKLK